MGEARNNTHLLSVVLLPDEGLPTRAIKGSRGISKYIANRTAGYHKEMVEAVLRVVVLVEFVCLSIRPA